MAVQILIHSGDEFREVLSRLDRVEDRLDKLEVEVRSLRSDVSTALGELERRTEERHQALRREMVERFDRVDRRFDEMYERMLVQTRWLIGSIAVIGAVSSILPAVGQFVR